MRVMIEEVPTAEGKSTASASFRRKFMSVLHGIRTGIHSRWPEWITLALYVAIVAFAIPYHEPWADEAQAWQLARSLPLGSLFQTYIRYEGSPGLWHFLLWVLNQMHVSYAGMHWICGAIAVASTGLLVLRSPLPRYLKLSVPFTYFLLFQYAVVARNYVLVPPLLFMIAIFWKKGPAVVALLLGLLANVSLHASVISGGLAIVYMIEGARDGALAKRDRKHELLFAAAMLLGLYTFAIWTAWPPHDLVIARVRGENPSFTLQSIASLVWAVCEPWILSVPFWIAIALCLRARRSLFYLLPVVLFAGFSGAVYANFWHAGLLVPLVFCLLWITWPACMNSGSSHETIGRVALIFMTGVQILWSAYALRYDHSQAYSPDLAASRVLQPLVREHATVAVTYVDEPWNQAYDAVGILPYFDRNIYINQREPFWWWSANNSTGALFMAALATRPRIVLVEVRPSHPGQAFKLKDAKIDLLVRAGYRLTNTFCGAKPERFELEVNSCHLVFQYLGDPQTEATGNEEGTDLK